MNIKNVKQTIKDNSDMIVVGVFTAVAMVGVVIIAVKQMEIDKAYNDEVNDFRKTQIEAGRAVVQLADGSYLAYTP